MKLVGMFFAVISMSYLYAQDPVKDADKILSKVSKNYRSYKSLKATFKLNIHSPENNVDENQTGTVYLKGNKYKLKMQGQEIICDNKTIWTYLEDANEVQINNYEPDEDEITPDKIFTIYEKGFLYKLDIDEEEKNKDLSMIELTPKDKEKPYFKIKLYIDSSNLIQKAIVYDKNGNRYTYQIQNLDTSKDFNDSFFTFDQSKHPKVEVVDLR